MTPYEVIARDYPPVPHKRTLLALALHARADRLIVWPKISTLCHESAQDERTVQRHLKLLVTVGHITRGQTKVGRGVCFSYEITFLSNSDTQSRKGDIGGPPMSEKGDMVSPPTMKPNEAQRSGEQFVKNSITDAERARAIMIEEAPWLAKVLQAEDPNPTMQGPSIVSPAASNALSGQLAGAVASLKRLAALDRD